MFGTKPWSSLFGPAVNVGGEGAEETRFNSL